MSVKILASPDISLRFTFPIKSIVHFCSAIWESIQNLDHLRSIHNVWLDEYIHGIRIDKANKYLEVYYVYMI